MRMLDFEYCYVIMKWEEIDIWLRELIFKIMLIFVDDCLGESDEFFDFDEMMEG